MKVPASPSVRQHWDINANGVVQTHREPGGDAGGALGAAIVAITGFGDDQMEGIRESLGIHTFGHHPVGGQQTGAREAFIDTTML
jgi:hypothetical protein